MKSKYDAIFMKRALELASLALGKTWPNPLVGAVIVHENRIIGEGYHIKAGEPHAEVNAINRVPDSLLREATIYVTLEPCSHFGRTPPCAELIVRKGIKRVVVGTIDTSAKVAGKGLDIMRRGGAEVSVGVLEDECRNINRRFFTYHQQKRPYIILKWAESSDGFIDRKRNAAKPKGPNWITGAEERLVVHRWRSEEHSIMIGKNTLLNDNPSLTTRFWAGNDPIRIVLAGDGKLDKNLSLIDDNKPALVFSEKPLAVGANKENIILPRPYRLDQLLDELYKKELQSVLVEGGSYTLRQFIEGGVWDEARIFRGSVLFGEGLTAPLIEGRKVSSRNFKDSSLDILIPWK